MASFTIKKINKTKNKALMPLNITSQSFAPNIAANPLFHILPVFVI